MNTNYLVKFFEENQILTVYDEGPDWDQNIKAQNMYFEMFNLPLVIKPPRGSRLRTVLTSLPEHFLKNISEEDRTKNMQELTKIRDSMTPEALSALHSAHFSNASTPWACQEASIAFEAAKLVIIQRALNPQLVVETAVCTLLQAICHRPSQMEMRTYVICFGFINCHKFYDCLIEDISNQEKFEYEFEYEFEKFDRNYSVSIRQVTLFGKKYLKTAGSNVLYDPKTQNVVGVHDKKMNKFCEIIEEEEEEEDEDEEEEVDVVKRFEFEGTKYLKSKNTGIIYNLTTDVIGKWNEKTSRIDFSVPEEEEENDEDEYGDCNVGPNEFNEFVFPVFQNDELVRSDEVRK
jgi:hypothetical protein